MIVRHPRLPDVTRDVDDPASWVAQGWVLESPPEPPEPPKRKPRRQKYPLI